MIPSTMDELHANLRDWPVADLRVAVAEAMPGVDRVTVACVVDWRVSEVTEFWPPLGCEQIGAIWRAAQRRAQ